MKTTPVKGTAKAETKQKPGMEAGSIRAGQLLRADIVTLLEEDSELDQVTIANETGISPTTLSLWLSDKYASDPTNVERKLSNWLSSRTERIQMESLAPAEPGFYNTRSAEELLSALQYAQALGDMVALLGVPGIGKSTVCREYQERGANVWIATLAAHTSGTVPVLNRIAAAVGAEPKGGASVLAEAISERVLHRRGLLIIDEVHHAAISTLDAIRAIHDETGTAIALVGDLGLLQKVEKMPQLRSRIGMRQLRRGALKDDVEALLDAWAITDKKQRKYLTRIADRPGALRAVTKTLRLANVMASGNGRTMQIEDLEAAGSTLTARSTREADHV